RRSSDLTAPFKTPITNGNFLSYSFVSCAPISAHFCSISSLVMSTFSISLCIVIPPPCLVLYILIEHMMILFLLDQSIRLFCGQSSTILLLYHLLTTAIHPGPSVGFFTQLTH